MIFSGTADGHRRHFSGMTSNPFDSSHVTTKNESRRDVGSYLHFPSY